MEGPEIHTPKPLSTTAASATAPSVSRPGGSPGRPPAPSPPTSTTRPWSCRPPPPGSRPKETSTSSRSRSTSRSGCTPPGDPRLVLPSRGPPERGRDPHLPADRPPAAPLVRQGPAQRGPGRHHRDGARTPRTCTTSSRSTPRPVHPARGPAVQRPDRRHPRRPDQRPWVGFPTHEQLETAVFDMVVAGRVVGDDVAIMMVEAEATRRHGTSSRTRARPPRPRRSSPPASRRRSPSSRPCATRSPSSPAAAKPTGSPAVPRLPGRRPRGGHSEVREAHTALAIADKHERENELDRIKDSRRRGSTASSRVARRRSAAPSGPDKEARPAAHPARQGPHRRPRPVRHPPAVRRGRGDPAGTRLGAVRARRDPIFGVTTLNMLRMEQMLDTL